MDWHAALSNMTQAACGWDQADGNGWPAACVLPAARSISAALLRRCKPAVQSWCGALLLPPPPGARPPQPCVSTQRRMRPLQSSTVSVLHALVARRPAPAARGCCRAAACARCAPWRRPAAAGATVQPARRCKPPPAVTGRRRALAGVAPPPRTLTCSTSAGQRLREEAEAGGGAETSACGGPGRSMANEEVPWCGQTPSRSPGSASANWCTWCSRVQPRLQAAKGRPCEPDPRLALPPLPNSLPPSPEHHPITRMRLGAAAQPASLPAALRQLRLTAAAPGAHPRRSPHSLAGPRAAAQQGNRGAERRKSRAAAAPPPAEAAAAVGEEAPASPLAPSDWAAQQQTAAAPAAEAAQQQGWTSFLGRLDADVVGKLCLLMVALLWGSYNPM